MNEELFTAGQLFDFSFDDFYCCYSSIVLYFHIKLLLFFFHEKGVGFFSGFLNMRMEIEKSEEEPRKIIQE